MTMDRRERMDDPLETMMAILDAFQARVWTALPAIVTKVSNLGTQLTIECQPALRAKITAPDNAVDWVDMPVLVDCPVVFPNGGGFLVTVPIKVGDEVLVIFSSRCIDAWWQSGGLQNQAELRMHDLSDGFAIPGLRSLVRTPAGAINADNLQVRNDAGDVYIELTPAKQIKLETPASVTINAGSITVNGPTMINGNTQVTGNFAASGGTFTHNGTNVGSTHKHSGVSIGGSNTGNPV